MSATLTTTLGAVTLAGIGLTIVALVVLHLLPTGLSPMRNAVSQYGITRFRFGYRLAAISLGIAAAAAAWGTARKLQGSSGALVALLVIFAGARLAISWFPMDLPGTSSTSTGRTHGLLAVLAFGAITLASFRAASLLNTTGQWSPICRPFHFLSYYLLLSLLAMGLSRRSPALGRNFGLVERAFYLGMFAALSLIGAALALNLS